MDIWQTLLVLLRRWYITLPVLAMTALLAISAGGRIDPTYNAFGTAIVISVPQPIVPGPDELTPEIPGASLGSDEAANAIAITLNGNESRAKAEAAGFDRDYAVSRDNRSSVLQLFAESDTQAASLETTKWLLAEAEAILRADQVLFGRPDGEHKETRVLAPPSPGEPTYDGKVRIQAVVVLVGVLVALLLAFAVEAAARSAARRRAAKAREQAPEPPAERPAEHGARRRRDAGTLTTSSSERLSTARSPR